MECIHRLGMPIKGLKVFSELSWPWVSKEEIKILGAYNHVFIDEVFIIFKNNGLSCVSFSREGYRTSQKFYKTYRIFMIRISWIAAV